MATIKYVPVLFNGSMNEYELTTLGTYNSVKEIDIKKVMEKLCTNSEANLKHLDSFLDKYFSKKPYEKNLKKLLVDNDIEVEDEENMEDIPKKYSYKDYLLELYHDNQNDMFGFCYTDTDPEWTQIGLYTFDSEDIKFTNISKRGFTFQYLYKMVKSAE